MLTEQEQRKFYEWFYPVLKGKDWKYLGPPQHMPNYVSDAVWDECGNRRWMDVEPLYNRNLVPNYQFFFTEVVPRLERERCDVTWGTIFTMRCAVLPKNSSNAYVNPDPYRAVFEYIEEVEK